MVAPTATTDRVCGAVKASLSTGTKVGVSVGVIAFIFVALGSAAFVWRRSQKITVQIAERSYEMGELINRDVEREGRVQRLLAAWQISEEHLTFLQQVAGS